MSQTIETLYREGVAAIRAGDRVAAREKLGEVVRLDPVHEQAWLWLSAAVESDDERITCLQNALTINPGNDAARRGLEKLGGSTLINANQAGEPEEPPDLSPLPHQEPPRRMEHAAAPAVERLFASAGQPVKETATGKRIQPASVLPKSTEPEEAWRKSLYNNQADGLSQKQTSAVFFRDEESQPDRNLLDLMNAWVSAIIFDVKGAYTDEMRVTSLGRWFFGLFIASTLASLSQALTILLTLSLQGMTIRDYQIAQWAPLVEQGVVDSGSLPIIPSGTALLLIIVFTFVGTMIGLTLFQLTTHMAASFLGGTGSFVETLHSMSIAEVAARLVGLIPAAVTGVFSGLSLLFGPILWLYGIALNIAALSAAHRNFGIGKSILALLFGWFLLGIFGCCLLAVAIFGMAPIMQ